MIGVPVFHSYNVYVNRTVIGCHFDSAIVVLNVTVCYDGVTNFKTGNAIRHIDGVNEHFGCAVGEVNVFVVATGGADCSYSSFYIKGFCRTFTACKICTCVVRGGYSYRGVQSTVIDFGFRSSLFGNGYFGSSFIRGGFFGNVGSCRKAIVNNFDSSDTNVLTVRTVLYSVQDNGRTGNRNRFIADIGGSTIKAKVSIRTGLSRNLNGNKLITICKSNGDGSSRGIGSIDTNMVIIVCLTGVVPTVDFNSYVGIKIEFLLYSGTCPAILGNKICNCFACSYGSADRGGRSIGSNRGIGNIGSGLFGRDSGIIRRIASALSVHCVETSEVVGIF